MDFQKALDLINKSKNILLTTHTRPDGDACGCIAAMYDVLTALGKKVQLILLSEVPEWYEFLFAQEVPVLEKDLTLGQLTQGQLAETDLVIIIDTNSYSQLPKFDEFLKQNTQPVLVIDHHVTTDNLGDVELIDISAAAAALIVFDLLKSADWPLTDRIAQALFVAVATDTGWFQFSNTDARAYRTCADLVDAGANPAQIHHDLYQNFSPQRLKLMTAMLNTLELHFDGRFATQQLLQADFKKTQASYKDTENLIDECRRLSSVEVAVLFVELPDGRIKCSLRSKEPVDVRIIAQKFGGGGHKTAAGAHLSGPVENAKKLIMAEVQKYFP
jgi:phosphoesterase RecJ-like protein